jgi:DNA-directed RNA polymerase subunit M/transcription elongation factor TFIIS
VEHTESANQELEGDFAETIAGLAVAETHYGGGTNLGDEVCDASIHGNAGAARSSVAAEGRPKRGRPRKYAPARDAASRQAIDEAKRLYNREYMRRWRSDPQNRERDRVNRKEWYYERKERTVRSVDSGSRSMCGYCHIREAVFEATRLRPSDRDPAGFVEVRIPYCGKC